jgi:hypothetical protein
VSNKRATGEPFLPGPLGSGQLLETPGRPRRMAARGILRARSVRRSSSGSLATFAAIRRASSRVSNLLRMVDAAGRKAGIVYLANFPEGDAGFGAAGLTSWSMTIRTGGAQ